MAVSLTTPITGSSQTGLTSPTYTLVVDTPPASNMKQWAVTALGGTQTGVTVHSLNSPFTLTMIRPVTYKGLSVVNPATGQLRSVPRNTFKFGVRKGVTPLAGQAPAIMQAWLVLDVPAGSSEADSEDIRAALSALIGALTQASAGLGDTIVTGIL